MADHLELQRKHLKTNFSCFFLDGVTAVGGFSALGLTSILPGMIHDIALRWPALKPWENRIASLVLVCFWGLGNITSFFAAGQFESLTHRKTRFLWLAAIARIGFPAMFLATVYMEELGYPVFLTVLLISMAWWSLLNGMLMPQWFDYIGRLIPARKRGILFGFRDGVGTILGIGILALFPMASRHLAFPHNYTFMFGMGVALLLLSYLTWTSLIEVPYRPEELKPVKPMRTQVADTLGILRRDPEYRRLMVVLGVLAVSAIAPLALVTLKAVNVLGLSPADTSAFTSQVGIVNIAAYALAMPLFGLFADRIGYKRVGIISYGILILVYVLVIFSSSRGAFLAAVALAGVVQGGTTLVAVNFPLEFVPENARPSYMALRSVFNLPFMLLPPLGGWLADAFGQDIVFGVAAVAVAGGLYVFVKRIRDPRLERATKRDTTMLEAIPGGESGQPFGQGTERGTCGECGRAS